MLHLVQLSLSSSLCWRHSDLRVLLINAVLVHGTIIQSRISECVDVTSGWMRSHRLQLNTAKTEIVWLTMLLTVCICCHNYLLVSALTWSRQSSWSVTLGFTLTPTILWDPTSWRPSLPVLLFYVGFGTYGLSSSHWCRVWCYRGWTIAIQCWLAFHYTLHGACNRWWTRPQGSYSRHQSAVTSRRSYANYTGWKFHGG